jgi:hypothetical protein
MTTSFLNRVDAERRVLSAVHRHTSGPTQLTGLSRAAIESWQGRTTGLDLREVVAELHALGDVCQRLSDRSHETFLPLDPRLGEQIDAGLAALEQALVKAFGPPA